MRAAARIQMRRARVAGELAMRRLDRSPRPLPSFVIIGAQRGGTTSLYQYLNRHPQVREPLQKEVQFLTLHFDRGLAWYQRHFPHLNPGEVTFEATPYYLFHPTAGARARVLPDTTRYIVMLRDPIERAYSHYLLNRANGVEPLSFDQAIAAEPHRVPDPAALPLSGEESRRHRLFTYVSRGQYADQIDRWDAEHPGRVLVLLSDDLFHSPTATLARILDFTKLDPWEPTEPVHAQSRSAAAPPIDPELRACLVERFAESNRRVAERLGREPSEWVSWPGSTPSRGSAGA